MVEVYGVWLTDEFELRFHFCIERILFLVCQGFIEYDYDLLIVAIFPFFEKVGDENSSEKSVEFIPTSE